MSSKDSATQSKRASANQRHQQGESTNLERDGFSRDDSPLDAQVSACIREIWPSGQKTSDQSKAYDEGDSACVSRTKKRGQRNGCNYDVIRPFDATGRSGENK